MLIILACDDTLPMADMLRSLDFTRKHLAKKRTPQFPGERWIVTEGFSSNDERQRHLDYWDRTAIRCVVAGFSPRSDTDRMGRPGAR